MDKIRIRGGKRLAGNVAISGAKNAALPILISTLLSDQKSVFSNVPNLHDIQTVLKLLAALGVEAHSDSKNALVTLNGGPVHSQDADYDLVRKMRASVLVLGPLLARFGKAKVSLPGGCAIGARPVNLHLSGLEKLGAEITLESGYVMAHARRLKGARVGFDFPSVGATEHLMMAAALAKGESVLENCAKEPEISDLAKSLRSMGVAIEGDGTETIRIQGSDGAPLAGALHTIVGDRIEAGTYLAAALVTQGEIRVEGIAPQLLESVLEKFEEAGAHVERGINSIRLKSGARPKPVHITTQPFPGFPTDMQAQLMACMLIADGPSLVTETIFENRFMHVQELARMGADITIRGNSAAIQGKEKILGAPVMATDLRASASLIIAALCAQGETIINRVYHLDRGYERLEEKLRLVGADVERIP